MKLKENSPNQISLPLLIGLQQLLADTTYDESTSSILQPLFEDTFPLWLKQYSNILRDFSKVYKVNREDD